MATKDENTDLLWLAVLVFAARAWDEWVNSSPAAAIQRGGARVYDLVHDDAGHKKDLPEKPWKIDKLIDLAADVGFPNPELAAAIAMAESGGVTNAKGDYRNGEFISWGLWQINVRAHPQFEPSEMIDPLMNAKAAFVISKKGTDWRPWSTWWADASKRVGPGQGRFRSYL